MKYILDTHALLWIVSDSSYLSPKVRSLFLDEKNDVFLSKASVWEMAIKISLKKLRIKSNLEIFIKEHVIASGIKILYITLDQLYKIETLPLHHKDPFDRLIITQAITENITIISSDTNFDKYNVQRVWN